MAPSNTQRHNQVKKGGHQSSKAQCASGTPNAGSTTNSQQTSTSSRKVSKRKFGETGPATPSYANNNLSTPQNNVSNLLPNSINQGSTARQHSGNLESFTAPATNGYTEIDSDSVNDLVEPDAEPVGYSPTNITAGSLQKMQSIKNSSEFSKQDMELIKIASYVVNLPNEYVVKFLRRIKAQNKAVTKETLLDEIFKHNIPASLYKEQAFPHQDRPNGATALSSATNQSVLPFGNSSGAGRASALQSQNSRGIDNTGRSEDQVDGLPRRNPNCPAAGVGNRRQLIDPRRPDAVYHNKINHVSSNSSAQDVSSTMTSSAKPQTSFQNTSAEKNNQVSKVPPQKQSGPGTSTAQSLSEDVVDGLLSSAPALNDLNRGSAQIVKTKEDEASGTPLKIFDAAEHLATCLKLVRDENRLLDSLRQCGQCKVKARDITFLPCGHVWACRSCAGPLYVCPCCKKKIIATVDTFLS